jgi:hypothetical protein
MQLVICVLLWSTEVGIATGWKAGVRFLAGAGDIYLLHSVQIGFGAHSASYPKRIEGSFPREAGA